MNILIIICGSIASYKVFDLISTLIKNGSVIDVILTANAEHFITKLSISSVINGVVLSDNDFFRCESSISHINITKEKNLIIVFSATANTISKFANGITDNLALTTLIATKKSILFVPAMNPEMWNNEIIKNNLDRIQKLKYVNVLSPIYGETACGDFGIGHIASIENIIQKIDIIHKTNTHNILLNGKKFLITNGATKENIDSLRYISNYSSGKQGNAIVDFLLENGAIVFLVTTTYKKEEKNLNIFYVNTADEMLNTCIILLQNENFFVAICVAAVCDWKIEKISKEKIKKNGEKPLILNLVQNCDILLYIATKNTNRPKYVVGFSAETDNLLENSRKKLIQKKCDIIIANNVSNNTGIGKDENEIYIITNNNEEFFSKRNKKEIAKVIVEFIIKYTE